MRKEELTSTIAPGNRKYYIKKESLVDKFTNWFRNFLENAE